MHGRLKVKTSEQQAAEKRAVRNEKMKIYRGAMSALLTHRLQHNEGQLKMTSGLLQANPDITTLWNIRKEALLHLLEESPDQETKDALLRRDMDISQDCLVTNPKSYGAWHHRCWCITQISKPDWSRELGLCNKYLALDERNFHVWDYRRFVVANAGILPKDELDYSTERINVNFSNYSAWHYRSKLLPQVHPSSTNTSSGLMSEEKRREELDLVQNAAFTDPDDSSAWFYHKWLLMGGKSSEIAASNPTPIILKLDTEKVRLFLSLSAPINANKACQLFLDGEKVDVEWQPATTGESHDTLWIFQDLENQQLSHANLISVKVGKDELEMSVSREKPLAWNKIELHSRPEEETEKLLEEELNNCTALLEMEPDSKWTSYARILIMKALDPEKYYQDIIDEFSKLSRLDSKRCCYYEDMRSKSCLEMRLKDELSLELDLSGQDLTRVYFKERLAIVQSLNLSSNNLKSVDALLPYLVECRRLNLDNNLIEKIDEGIDLNSSLVEVSIRQTPLAQNLLAVEALRLRFPSIKFIVD